MLDKHGGILLVLSLILDGPIVGACCLVSGATPLLHGQGVDYHWDSIALPLFLPHSPLVAFLSFDTRHYTTKYVLITHTLGLATRTLFPAG